ncbi:hypothetical protein HYY69_02715 [Candidatus Woesearchaeota archaeon]|nr:hypothetical protein [Candidatus Woesearchaeota archaeon]
MFEIPAKEYEVLRTLTTPRKIQGFINTIPCNFEEEGDTCLSPLMVMRQKRAHCIEGAMVAAIALRMQGFEPLVVDLEATKDDFDHVIAVFKQHGFWGAISKTNHGVLRYRDPVYRDIRELVMSYFHEYFINQNGKKSLRRYTQPINLAMFDAQGWMTAEDNVWYVSDYLTKVKHIEILTRTQIASLRNASITERKVGEIVQWQKKGKKTIELFEEV